MVDCVCCCVLQAFEARGKGVEVVDMCLSTTDAAEGEKTKTRCAKGQKWKLRVHDQRNSLWEDVSDDE